jgi:hypothetical protein
MPPWGIAMSRRGRVLFGAVILTALVADLAVAADREANLGLSSKGEATAIQKRADAFYKAGGDHWLGRALVRAEYWSEGSVGRIVGGVPPFQLAAKQEMTRAFETLAQVRVPTDSGPTAPNRNDTIDHVCVDNAGASDTGDCARSNCDSNSLTAGRDNCVPSPDSSAASGIPSPPVYPGSGGGACPAGEKHCSGGGCAPDC